jgi:hypothetical protein
VVFGGPLRDHQPGGDLLVAAASGDQPGHLQLPGRERRLSGDSRRWRHFRRPVRRLLQGVGDGVGGGQFQATLVGGLERSLAQGLPGLALAVPVIARHVLVAVQVRAHGLQQTDGGAEQDRGALVLVARPGDPRERLHAEGGAHPVVAAQPQALLLQPSSPVEITPAPGRRPQRPQRVRGVRAADVFAAGLGQRGKLPVAGDGALFVTGQGGGDRQAEQQLGALAAADDGGQDRQPVRELGGGLRQVSGEQTDMSRDPDGERPRGRVVQLPGQAGALLQQRLYGAPVAAGGSQETGEQQPPRPPDVGLADPGQRLAEPVPALADMARAPVVKEPDVHRDAQPGLGLARLVLAEVLRRLDIGVLPAQPGRQVFYLRAQPVDVDPPGQLLMPVPVPPPQRRVLAGGLQEFLPELAQGFRQPVPHPAFAVGGDQDRLVGQRRQQVQHLVGGQPPIGADAFGRVQLEPAGEHRQPGPQQPLGRAAQLIAPLDRGPQCLLPGGPGAAAPGQQAQPVT